MPELRQIVKNMIDAGEDEAAIASVIKRHSELNTPPPDRTPAIPPAPFTGETVRSVGPEEPDTFWGGVKKSFTSGEALKAGVEGAKGWLQGAVLDIPSSLNDAGNALAAGLDSLATNPEAHVRAMGPAFKEMGREFADTVANAGSNPRAFGRLSGQLTGQPLVGEGILAGAGAGLRAARLPTAKVMESVGGAMEGARAATAGVPYTKTGAIAKIAGRTVQPAGRALRQAGENMRMRALGVEPPNDLAARAPASPADGDGNIFSDQSVAGNQPPIVEFPNDLAARGGGTQPASHFEPFDAIDIDPIFRNPPKGPPPSGAAPTLSKAMDKAREKLKADEPPTKAETKNPPTAEKFEPSVDPADLVNLTDEQKAFLQSKKDELRAALERMKAKDAGVDPATGEIVPPKRAGAKWKNPFERFNNETGAVGRDISDIIQRQAAEKAAREGAARPTANMPDWGLETVRAPRPVNPLRPEVPEGQVSNRQMFELSDQVAAQNRQTPGQQFADEVLGGPEFSEDMLFTPDELRNPDVPLMEGSPFENQFDPRIAPGGVVSEAAPSFADLQKRVYELVDKEVAGTLTSAELAEAQALNKQWRNHPEFGKDVPQGSFGPKAELTPKKSSFSDRVKRLWEDEAGEVGDNVQPKRVPSVGDRSWDVMHPSGKPIGNVSVTRAEIAAARKGGHVPDEMSDVDVSNAMFDMKLEILAKENGYTVNDLNRLRINYNTKAGEKTAAPKTESAPTPKVKKYDITGKEVKTEDTPKLVDPKTEKLTFDPDRAFEPGGDIQPVAKEASRLEAAKAPDASFKKLLPRELQYALGEGETWKSRVTQLVDTVTEADLNPVDMREVRAQLAAEEVGKTKAAAEAKQMSEINKFLMSIHETMPDSTIPLLDLKKIDLGSLSKGKLNQNAQDWVSPRLIRQNPNIARKYKDVTKKNK